MSDAIWETFDGLSRLIYKQGRKVAELEEKVADLERRLTEREAGRKTFDGAHWQGEPPPAPLGFTLYENGKAVRVVMNPALPKNTVVAVHLSDRPEVNPDAEAPTTLRVRKTEGDRE